MSQPILQVSASLLKGWCDYSLGADVRVGSMRRSENVPLKGPDGPTVAAQMGTSQTVASFPGPPTVLQIRPARGWPDQRAMRTGSR